MTKKIQKVSATKLNVKKLKAKKKYYVRVRAYKIVKGAKYVSSWFSIKNIKVRK